MDEIHTSDLMTVSTLTDGEETFARLLAETGIAAVAYREAFPERSHLPATVWPEASRLAADPKVRARVEAHRQRVREEHNVTLDEVTAAFRYARDAALTDERPNYIAATMANDRLARMGGWLGGSRRSSDDGSYQPKDGLPGDLERLTTDGLFLFWFLQHQYQGLDEPELPDHLEAAVGHLIRWEPRNVTPT